MLCIFMPNTNVFPEYLQPGVYGRVKQDLVNLNQHPVSCRVVGISFAACTVDIREPTAIPRVPLLCRQPGLSESRNCDINVVRGPMDVPESP